MIFFQSILIYHLAYIIELKYLSLNTYEDSHTSSPSRLNQSNSSNNFKQFLNSLKQCFSCKLSPKVPCKTILNFLWKHSLLIFLSVSTFLQIYDLCLCYSLISILICPLKTWNLIIAFFLIFVCNNLNSNNFFIEVTKSSVNLSDNLKGGPNMLNEGTALNEQYNSKNDHDDEDESQIKIK